jgi:diadenosine tetraphosphate (Ap4A) HIT family hydrolase
MSRADCAFCQPLPRERILAETDVAIAFLDGFPVSKGHTLIIPKRHVPSVFDLRGSEFLMLWSEVAAIRKLLADKYHPAGFNIGVNDGAAAGQTVRHAHIHIIPRHAGDVPDHRGGAQ